MSDEKHIFLIIERRKEINLNLNGHENYLFKKVFNIYQLLVLFCWKMSVSNIYAWHFMPMTFMQHFENVLW